MNLSHFTCPILVGFRPLSLTMMSKHKIDYDTETTVESRPAGLKPGHVDAVNVF